AWSLVSARVSTASSRRAVSRIRSASSRVRSDTPRRWRGCASATVLALPLLEHDAVAPVDLFQFHAPPLVERRRQVLADVVGADGKLPVPPVDEHGELDAVGPAEVEERV